MIFKELLRLILPRRVRHFLVSCIPKIYKLNTLVLEAPQLIENLISLKGKFLIREINSYDLERLKAFHHYKGLRSFNNNTMRRLNAPEFVGLAAIDIESDEIAYLSWVITASIPYFEEFGIYMNKGDYLVKDIFVVPKYRHKGLSTRMEQERVNYCIRRGDCRKVYTQPLASNVEGNKVYYRMGYKKVQENYLIRWYVFGVYRSLSGFLRNPFRRIIK